MANIVVTSSTNYIKVEFNDYYPDYYKVCEAYYNRNDLEKIEVQDGFLKVHVLDESDWTLSYTATTGAFIVDSVDAATPTDNLDLASKLAALIIA